MKTMTNGSEVKSRRSLSEDVARVLIGTAAVLMVPFLAMQFSREVNWTLGDFVVIAVLLITAGLLHVAVSRKVNNARYRAVLGAVLVLGVLLIWVELAVGIFNTPFAGS